MHRPIAEECGVFGLWLPEQNAIAPTIFGLVALQHRGQESAGISWRRQGSISSKRGLGLVGDVFPGFNCDAIASGAIGHVRFSSGGKTAGSDTQPLTFNSRLGPMALALNGSLSNSEEIRRQLVQQGSIFQTDSDAEVVAHLVARSTTNDLNGALISALGQVQGAYAFVLLTPERLLALRDPRGVRPLALGKMPGGWAVASETCALAAVGAEFFREVEPGELVSLTDTGLQAIQLLPPRGQAFCVFEFIYFARPDSEFAGRNVHIVRRALGRALAEEAPAPADIVTGVPDSSLSAAAGYAEAAGLPYETGLIRNRYLGRTYIQPGRQERKLRVALKLNPISGVVAGKKVCLVDDSLVRGTTCLQIVKILKEAGAKEVHLRIASPPIVCGCGPSAQTGAELFTQRVRPEEMASYLGVDSLKFLSLTGMLAATGLDPGALCSGCFAGNYPKQEGN